MSTFRSNAQKKADEAYEAKRAGTRSRNWTAVLYPEDLPDDFRDKIDDFHIKWVESPLHDKDLNADGQPKKPHIHTLLMFSVVKSEKQVMDLLGEAFGFSDGGSIVGVAKPMIVSDRSALVRYFAHLDNPSKAQYDVADIIGHGGADIAELMRYSQTETISMMVEVERYIEDNDIVELCDLSKAIRTEHPEWYTLVATKCTLYFTAFIRSRRHKTYMTSEPKPHGFVVDLTTGEVVEK